MRIGNGFDIHTFKKGRKLILGGVEIPSEKGLVGHSDADVVIHSVIDAILGAMALGDIGEHFPDTDKNIEGISGTKMLKDVLKLFTGKIINLDVTVVCEHPKLSPYKKKMADNLASVLQITPHQISIKAKTMEKIGEIGKGNAIMAFSTVLIQEGK